MLEEIRVQVMRLLRKNEKKLKTWVTDFSPECMKLYIDYRALAHTCKVEFNGDWGYEVSDGEDRHTVNLKRKNALAEFGIYQVFLPACHQSIDTQKSRSNN